MSNEMRILKYENLINDVNNVLKNEKIFLEFGGQYENIYYGLAMVFDYDKLNEYGRLIIERSSLMYITTSSKDYHKDNKFKIEAAKAFVEYCKDKENRVEAYEFVFWAMMVLTVDKTDAEERLSLICDFARMLRITDDEMEDMLMIIKAIYHGIVAECKTETVSRIFSEVLINSYHMWGLL